MCRGIRKNKLAVCFCVFDAQENTHGNLLTYTSPRAHSASARRRSTLPLQTWAQTNLSRKKNRSTRTGSAIPQKQLVGNTCLTNGSGCAGTALERTKPYLSRCAPLITTSFNPEIHGLAFEPPPPATVRRAGQPPPKRNARPA